MSEAATYFIAFEVNAEDVHQRINDLIKQFAKEFPAISTSRVTVSRSHLSLLVIRIPNESQVRKAKEVFENIARGFIPKFKEKDVHVSMRGVKKMPIGSNKDHTVVYASVDEEGHNDLIDELIYELKEAFKEIGIDSVEKNIKRHLSLFNTKIGGSPMFVPDEVLDKFKDYEFGRQKIEGVQFLSTRKDVSYYKFLSEVYF